MGVFLHHRQLITYAPDPHPFLLPQSILPRILFYAMDLPGIPRSASKQNPSHIPTCCHEPPHDVRITKTAGDQLTEDMETPTRTHSLASLIK